MLECMNIRFASKDDSNSLSSLIINASRFVRESDFTSEGWEMLENTKTPEKFQERFNSDNYFCVVYEIDQKIVGYLAMVDYEKIDHMFVLPSHRKRGICKSLWNTAKENCVEFGKGKYYWVRSSTYAYTSKEVLTILEQFEIKTIHNLRRRK